MKKITLITFLLFLFAGCDYRKEMKGWVIQESESESYYIYDIRMDCGNSNCPINKFYLKKFKHENKDDPTFRSWVNAYNSYLNHKKIIIEYDHDLFFNQIHFIEYENGKFYE